MKRRYLALLTLSFMIASNVAPFYGASMEIETDVAAQTETTITKEITITKEMPITKDIPTVTNDIPLGSGISNIIFDDNLMNKEIVRNNWTSYKVPNNKGFKSFMSYKAITDLSSKQYKIQKEYAYTGEFGIRQVNERFCVAIGTAFDMEIGTYFDLVLENGEIIPCVLSDVKDNRHTLSDNITTASNGCVSEFIVNVSKLKKDIKMHGDISYAENDWNSPVVEIRVYEKNILD